MSQDNKQSRTLSSEKVLLTICAALLVIASSIGIFFFASGSGIIAGKIRATATVRLKTMATSDIGTTMARANATSTTQANATTTVQANAAATADAQAATAATAGLVTPYNVRGKTLAVDDAMSINTSSVWGTYSGSDYGCVFSGTMYHVREFQQGYLVYCPAYGVDFSNFVYQVQMKIVKGDHGGIVFRVNTNANTYYYFQIGTSGSYTWGSNDGSGYTALSTASSPAIKVGMNQSNLIAVVARGGNFDLYVNKQHIDSFSDGSYSHGQIGVCAQEDNNTTEAVFSNVQLWTL